MLVETRDVIRNHLKLFQGRSSFLAKQFSLMVPSMCRSAQTTTRAVEIRLRLPLEQMCEHRGSGALACRLSG